MSIYIEGVLKMRTPLHIGTGEEGEMTDAVVRKNGIGEIVIPGTSIAGALRSIAIRIAPYIDGGKVCKIWYDSIGKKGEDACSCLTCTLFGNVRQGTKQEREGKNSKIGASKLWVYDAVCKQNATEIKDFVGIDRKYSTAMDGAKYDIEYVPTDSKFDFKVKLDGDGDDKQLLLLKLILAEWQHKRAWLGAKSAAGFGGFELDGFTVKQDCDLNEADNFLHWLRSDGNGKKVTEGVEWLKINGDAEKNMLKDTAKCEIRTCSKIVKADYIHSSFLLLESNLAFSGGFLVSELTNAALWGIDAVPLTGKIGDMEHPVLPGSSLRGILRSQIEKILRTKASFIRQDEKLQSRVCCETFDDKYSNERSCGKRLEMSDNKENKIMEQVTKTCLACQMFGSTLQGSRLVVEDAPFKRTETQSKPLYKLFDYLAIDRFTGGGKFGAKFDALALWQPTFSIRIFLQNPQDWEVALLLYVLRDLEEGLVNIGSGGNKGFGFVKTGRFDFTSGYIREKDNLFQGQSEPCVKREGIFTVSRKSGSIRDIAETLECHEEIFSSLNEQIQQILTENCIADDKAGEK